MDKIIAESKKISEILVDDYEVNPDNVSLLKFNDKKHSEKVFELYKELI